LVGMILPFLSVGLAPAQPSSSTTSPFDLQGHRGARGLRPENTIPAFLHALELGVTTLEMDVVIAKDGTVVVSHEPWFSGTICSLPSGEPVPIDRHKEYRIFEMTYDEVARFDCGSRGHFRFPRQQRMKAAKPRLRDVIEAAETYVRKHRRPPVQYNIETKSRPEWDGVFHPDPVTFTLGLYDVLLQTGVKDRTTLQSFDVRTLQAARRADQAWRLALLVDAENDLGLAANIETLGFTPHIYSPHYRLVDEALLREAHTHSMLVIPWTVNTLEEMQRLKALGVDGLITDYPDIGVTLLENK
ncbi:MAG: glycerophosphodiester phosphodiesterase family protein, partial [Rhodothermales bacterium]